MISPDLIPCTFSFRLMRLALDCRSACGVFPGQGEVGHTVRSVSAYNFTVYDDKAQLHRDKQADFCVALIYVANSIQAGLCRYPALLKAAVNLCWRFIYSLTYLFAD